MMIARGGGSGGGGYWLLVAGLRALKSLITHQFHTFIHSSIHGAGLVVVSTDREEQDD